MPQRRELRSVVATRAATAPQRCRDTCCNSAAALQHYNVASLQCCSVVSLQCYSNASLHRCSSTLPSPQSSRASCDVVTSDVAVSIFVHGLCPLTFVRQTFVHRTSVHGSCVLSSWRPTPCRPVVLRPAILRPPFSSNIYLTSVQYLCVTGYSQQRTLFFKLCVVLEFCS
jgi:hypothetical protein